MTDHKRAGDDDQVLRPPPIGRGGGSPQDEYLRRARSVQKVISLVQIGYLIVAIHTGANLHGGRPTIFGEFDANPTLGWLIGLSWLVVIPFLQALAPRTFQRLDG